MVEMTGPRSLCETRFRVLLGGGLNVHAHMQLRICSEDVAYGWKKKRMRHVEQVCAHATRLHAWTCWIRIWNIVWSVCSFGHKWTPSLKYVKIPPWARWLFRFRSKLTLVTSCLTLFRFCVLTTQSFPWPGADLTGSTSSPPGSARSFQRWVSLPLPCWNVWPAETWPNEGLRGPPASEQLLVTCIMPCACARTQQRHFCTFFFLTSTWKYILYTNAWNVTGTCVSCLNRAQNSHLKEEYQNVGGGYFKCNYFWMHLKQNLQIKIHKVFLGAKKSKRILHWETEQARNLSIGGSKPKQTWP